MPPIKDIKLLLLDVDGTLTDTGIYIMENGMQLKKFNARDGMGIQLAMKAGIKVGLISHSTKATMIEERAKMLNITHVYVGKKPKTEILNQWTEELHLSKKQVAYIGDDVNDMEIMQAVGLAVCPADAVSAIKEIANVMLTKNGGQGCVREFIDRYLLN